ncbi:3'(2'),5'-bisphosphate nucleotidase CysQ [Glaciihabitans sp. INWT7]|nr:3'(2'),5'-bisphosphate nucleotidase CysQ [Glaciihabitans sp. INWT7]
MSISTITSDIALATDLARRAGELLLSIQSSARSDEIGTPGLKARGDAAAQAYLDSRLRAERAGDAILSEEAKDSSARLGADRVWIIDPLDGTREFSEGRPDWAVHVALWQEGELSDGAVALPGLRTVLSSSDIPSPRTRSARLRLAVSRSRPPALVEYLIEHLDAEVVAMGSAGYKTSAVVRGEVDAYIHAGGQYEWDSAAPVVVARAAGLFTSRIDGSALRYNQPNPYLPDIVVCTPDIADLLLAAIGNYPKEGARD